MLKNWLKSRRNRIINRHKMLIDKSNPPKARKLVFSLLSNVLFIWTLHVESEGAPKAEDGEGAAEGEEGSGAEGEAEPELTDEEESIRANLADGEALPNETLDKILPAFWNEEPFR